MQCSVPSSGCLEIPSACGLSGLSWKRPQIIWFACSQVGDFAMGETELCPSCLYYGHVLLIKFSPWSKSGFNIGSDSRCSWWKGFGFRFRRLCLHTNGLWRVTQLCLLHGALLAVVIALSASLLCQLWLWHCEVPVWAHKYWINESFYVPLLCGVQKNRNRNLQ